MDSNYNYQQPPMDIKNYFLEFIQTLAVCLIIGIIIYWQIAQPHKVSGDSMFPTFKNGDYIITNKVLYKISAPQHGDVIVLHSPPEGSQVAGTPAREPEDFIKRIVAIPGDKIKVSSGHVFLNGQQLTEQYLRNTVYTSGEGFLAEDKEIEIPKDDYFVLGDNRERSSDSRAWGFVPRNQIVGKVMIRYWPQNALAFNPGDIKY